LQFIFEFHQTFAIHHIYTLWVLSDKLHIYTMEFITIQFQLCRNNSFSTTMQLPYDYNHNVMLKSFFLHPSIFNMWHYEDFCDFFEIWCPSSIMIIHFRWSWIMTHDIAKAGMWHINWILETNIYMYLGRLVHNHR
jgi:hypothetical protein